MLKLPPRIKHRLYPAKCHVSKSCFLDIKGIKAVFTYSVPPATPDNQKLVASAGPAPGNPLGLFLEAKISCTVYELQC